MHPNCLQRRRTSQKKQVSSLSGDYKASIFSDALYTLCAECCERVACRRLRYLCVWRFWSCFWCLLVYSSHLSSVQTLSSHSVAYCAAAESRGFLQHNRAISFVRLLHLSTSALAPREPLHILRGSYGIPWAHSIYIRHAFDAVH